MQNRQRSAHNLERGFLFNISHLNWVCVSDEKASKTIHVLFGQQNLQWYPTSQLQLSWKNTLKHRTESLKVTEHTCEIKKFKTLQGQTLSHPLLSICSFFVNEPQNLLWVRFIWEYQMTILQPGPPLLPHPPQAYSENHLIENHSNLNLFTWIPKAVHFVSL